MSSKQHKPGYKHTPLGWIPEEWNVVELGEFVNILSGDSPSNHNLMKAARYPYLKVEDLNNNYKYQITSREYTDIDRNLVPTASTIFPKRGAAILNNKVRINSVPVQMDSNLMAIYPSNDRLNNEFLYYLVKKIALYKIADTSTIPQINNKHIYPFRVTLPTIGEQEAITQYMITWDNAIQKAQQLIGQLKQRNKGISQQLLKPKANWKEYKLSDIFERVTRKNTEVNTNIVTISAQRGFVRQDDFFNKQIASEILDNYFLVEKGEFCYNKSYSKGYDWGATKRLNDFEKAVVTTLYICFRFKEEAKHSGEFFEYFFESGVLDVGLSKIAHEGGRAHGLLNVTPHDFFGLKVTLPDKAGQVRIHNILKMANNELKLYEQQLSNLQQQKKGLMQKLLSGEVRVKI